MDESYSELKLVSNLKNRREIFLHTRKKLGVGSSVGLAVLPFLHDYFPISCIVPTYKSSALLNKPGIYYEAPFGKYGMMRYIQRGIENKKRIIVLPNYNLADTYFVSMSDIGYKGRHDKSFLNCSNEVLQGLFAHELSHWVHLHGHLDDDLAAEIDIATRNIHLSSFMKSEAKIDLIAAKHGFKRQILATIDHTITHLDKFLNSKTIAKDAKERKNDFLNRRKCVEENS